MTLLLLATLALSGIGLDIVRHILAAVGETSDDWDTGLAAELAVVDRIPVADGLTEIRRRTR